MAIEQKSDGRTVLLKGVRFSFCDRLYEADKTSEDSDKETHGLNFIIEHDGPYADKFEENKRKVGAALKKAGELSERKNPDLFKVLQEDNPKRLCFRKGEKFKNREGKVYQGYEGNYAFSANGPKGGLKRPKMFDRNKNELIVVGATDSSFKEDKRRQVTKQDLEEIIYGGGYGDVIVSFFHTSKGSDGIFATVESIRAYERGEKFGGAVHVDADDFDDLEDVEDSFGSAASASKPDDDLDF